MSSHPKPVHDAMDRYGPLIMRIIWRVTHSEEDARDLFQETFLRLHTALSRGDRIDHPKAWTCRTALNLSLNWQKRQQREKPEAAVPLQAELALDGDIVVEQNILLDQIRMLSARLPERQRDVFILRHFEGLPFADIGKILGCTPETARANEYQALQKMKTWMNESSCYRK